MQMAVRHSDLVRRLVLYGTTLGKFEYDRGDLISLTPEDRSVQFQRENYKRFAPDPARWPILFSKLSQIKWEGFSRDQLRAIKTPVLMAVGDHDSLGPRLESVLDLYRPIAVDCQCGAQTRTKHLQQFRTGP